MVNDNEIFAYLINNPPNMELQAAPIEREWMDNTSQRFAYRCLPLNIANQCGWFLTCPCTFELYWYGGPNKQDIELRFLDFVDPSVSTHFGFGVLTFSLPYLKGPTNMPKDGIQPLEGVVETDWAFSTFTMNWKVTRPGEWIRFNKGEPVCMIVPIPRGIVEQMIPRAMPLAKNEELNAKYREWEESRSNFLTGLNSKDPEAVKRGWQKDYFQGKTAEGGTFDGHQTRLDIKEFQHEE
jgi:Family of unknown function (DUF6065)